MPWLSELNLGFELSESSTRTRLMREARASVSARSRTWLLVASHLLVGVIGVFVVDAFAGREGVVRSLGSPQKRLGLHLMVLLDHATPKNISQTSSALAAAKSDLGDPTASVLELRILAVAAAASNRDADIARAIAACQARAWDKCERANSLAMGAER